jgi:hypothetical protein
MIFFFKKKNKLFSLFFVILFSSVYSEKKFTWMLASSSLSKISNISSSLAQYYFSQNNTYIMDTLPSNYKSIPSIIFQSFATFNKTITNGTFTKNIKAVVYDCENWTFTPIEEQINPPFQEFASLAHKHNLIVIFTPAVDLVSIIYNGTCKGSTNYEKYLNCSIAYHASLYSDIFEIQAQGSENNVQIYYNFVKSAALQAKKANSNIMILAGLSTGPDGQNTSSYALYNATIATQDIVEGYWLNIPGNSPYCPKCTAPNPQLAVDYLLMLLNKSSTTNNIYSTTTTISTTTTNYKTTNNSPKILFQYSFIYFILLNILNK